MKKLALLLCFVLLVTMFAGCGGKGKDKDATGNTVGDGIFSTETVNFKDENSEATYIIIRSDNASAEVSTAALTVFQKYKKGLGASPKNLTDSTDGTDKYEILVGDTNRPESAKAKQYLSEKVGGRHLDYIICSIGKKIVIYGATDTATTNAATYFIENYLKGDTVSGGIKYTFATEGNFKDVTVNGVALGKYTIIRPRINSSFMTYSETEKFVEKVLEYTGYQMYIKDDTVTAETDYELIIGDCARPDVTKLDIRDEYRITVSGKKIFLNGGNHASVTMAVSEFTKLIQQKGTWTDSDSVIGSYAEAVKAYDKSTYYTPTFWDDFDDISGDHVNENGLDTTKWKLITAGKKGYGGYKAVRATDPEHVYVKDGMFQIHPYVDHAAQTYYGGFLRSEGRMKFTYGYIEYSAKIPDGPSFWTALWLRCTDKSGASRPEIDVAECFGNSKTYSFNLHTWPGEDAAEFGVEHTSLDGGKYPDKKKECPDDKKFNDDFHTYGMLWTDEVAWATCDGTPFFKYNMGDKETDAECFGKLADICISLACGFEEVPGGANPNDAGPEVWNDTGIYYVDWVGVYQIEDTKQVMVFGEDAN
ncbi:MAG: family 16 glycosylhydrolase [Clostridia bacterium]|nr:family 16 glycosylhydrolase [Clostridia bacterium]